MVIQGIALVCPALLSVVFEAVLRFGETHDEQSAGSQHESQDTMSKVPDLNMNRRIFLGAGLSVLGTVAGGCGVASSGAAKQPSPSHQ